MSVTVSQPQNIKTIDGNGFAVYKDSITNLFMVKDVNGQVSILVADDGISGSGTVGRLSKFTSANVLGDSIVSESQNTLNVLGNIIAETVSAILLTKEKIEVGQTINIPEFFQYNLVNILINNGTIINNGALNIL